METRFKFRNIFRKLYRLWEMMGNFGKAMHTADDITTRPMNLVFFLTMHH